MTTRPTLTHILNEGPLLKGGNPRGSTLTEVLMSILIMSIGLVSVATMFPLSLMRSIQATQLTSGTILRYNAQAQFESDTMIVFDPDGDRNNTLAPDSDVNFTEHYNTRYLVDPLGYFIMADDSSALKGTFGNDGGTALTDNNLLRFPGFKESTTPDLDQNGTPGEQADCLIRARLGAGLPDSWKNEVEARAVSIATDRKSLVLSSNVDLYGITISPTVKYRAIIFDAEGRQSQSRDLTAVTPGTYTIAWKDRLPDRIGTPGNVRIDVQESKYTWLMTVRRQPQGAADIDVVIFDKRPFGVKDEQIYMRTTSQPVFQQSNDKAYVQYTTKNPPDAAPAPQWRPALHKGGWVFDLQNAHWYRVQGYRETDLGGGLMEAELQLGQKASGDGKWAVFMRGVVDVYPIGTKTP